MTIRIDEITPAKEQPKGSRLVTGFLLGGSIVLAYVQVMQGLFRVF